MRPGMVGGSRYARRTLPALVICAMFLIPLMAVFPVRAVALSQAETTVFYSGGDHAGEDSGSKAGAYVMVQKPFKSYEVWAGTSECNSNRAVPQRPSRTF